MQLHDLRSHPVIKVLSYFGFGLIILSFIFFYGWDTDTQFGGADPEAYGRIEAEGDLNILPGRKWETIQRQDVRLARHSVLRRKLATMDPTLQMIFAQEFGRLGSNLERLLVSDAEAAEQAVDRILLRRLAVSTGVVVTRDEAIQWIQDQPGLEEGRFNQLLREQGLSEGQYIRRLQDDHAAAALQRLVATEVRPTLAEMWESFVSDNEKLSLELVPILSEDFKDQLEPTDEDLEAYLAANEEDYRVRAKRKYGFIRLSRSDVMKDLNPTAQDLESFLAEHEADFTRPEAALIEDLFFPVSDDQPTTAAQALVDSARAMLAAAEGADSDTNGDSDAPGFDAIKDRLRAEHEDARIYSRDVGPVDRGGDSIAVHGAAYVEAAFATLEGAASEPVRSSLGIHIIRRVGTRPAGLPPYDEIDSGVRAAFVEERSKALFKERSAAVDDAVQVSANVRDVAAKAGLEYQETDLVDANDANIVGIGDLSQHRGYILRNLRTGRPSELIPVIDMVCVIEILEENESYIPQLDEVRGAVTLDHVADNMSKAASAAAEAALDRIRAGEDFAAVAADARPSATPGTAGTGATTTTPPLTRAELSFAGRIEGLNFGIQDFPDIAADDPTGAAGISPLGFGSGTPKGYAFWRIASVERPSREEFEKQRSKYVTEYLQRLQLVQIEEWLADIRGRAVYDFPGAPDPQ